MAAAIFLGVGELSLDGLFRFFKPAALASLLRRRNFGDEQLDFH